MEATTKKQGKFFYGWVIVLAGAMVVGAGIGLFVNCNGVFVRPVTEDLGFSLMQFSLYPTIASTLGMLTSVLYGQFYQKRRIKPFMLMGAVVCSLCVFGYSLCSKLWQFYLLATLYGFCSTPILVMTVAILVNNWFVEKKSLATGLAFSGSGLTAAVMTPVATRVVANMGWRMGYRLLSVTGAVLTLTAIVFLIREKPEDMGLLPLGAEKLAAPKADAPALERPGITRQQAVREPALYIMIIGFFTLMLVGMSINPNVINYLGELGYDPTFAASVSSMYLFVMMFGKVILGAAFDKLGSTASAILTGSCMIASVTALLLAGLTPWMPFVFAICFGFGYSTLSVPVPYLTGENFGAKEYAAIYSLVNMLSGLGGSVGMILTGRLFDVTGSYRFVWILYFGVAVFSTTMLTLSTVISRKKGFNPGAYRPGKAKNLQASAEAGN